MGRGGEMEEELGGKKGGGAGGPPRGPRPQGAAVLPRTCLPGHKLNLWCAPSPPLFSVAVTLCLHPTPSQDLGVILDPPAPIPYHLLSQKNFISPSGFQSFSFSFPLS